MTVPPQSVEALRRAAATRPDVARVVLVERRVEPRSEQPFTDVRLVVVLDDPPTGPEQARQPVRELARLLAPALGDLTGWSISVPTAAGAGAAVRDGRVLHDRDAP